ncbi:pyrimidine-nucleoside phosphorylase [Desulfallas thermosapovorans]|uniref:Pyrimidine-nucleoside phosphorylase n=1 Tax=Desulfallas thermosapovorans DSM 6562 TaxID=1121431 RepID=A0A5S4ZRP8_9FIRM|nr:pyrimidine-nucleoside phosphorylase [Desulfallas thermosapovorans]TYO95594.1 pyrimidine-nucleoside phosphorylase/thymidine phosphorylase [Desulfallas thermosapovorans DSM 6562]
MRMVDLIQKKRDGHPLAKEEIDFIIEGFTGGSIPDYQMSAFLMAVYFQGMDAEETTSLTMAMVNSGDVMDLSGIRGVKVDKHSTGGVGDKTSLIVGPLVAAVGVPVAKMSGRGLGHTGGTIDKLESIAGFNVELTEKEFVNQVNEHKIAIVSQTGNLTPADKKLYALRDVTATVSSIPLIASSIMSKKIASGADAVVLDVKVGSGAFMKSLPAARELAETMVRIGKGVNKKTIAVITDMNQPLGYAVGNANEVMEAVQVLGGRGEAGLTRVCLTVAAHMTVAGGIYAGFDQAYAALAGVLQSGRALTKFKQFIQAQGGNPAVVDNPGELLPRARYQAQLKSPAAGYVQSIVAEQVGTAAMLLGAGRKTKNEPIDHAAGITLQKKVGDKVEYGEVLAYLHSNREITPRAMTMLSESFIIGTQRPEELPVVYDVIE